MQQNMQKFALIFPGQGSQFTDMLAPYESDPVHQHIINDYCARASKILGYDLHALIKNNPNDQLNQTEYTQPALLVASVIAFEIFKTQYTSEKPALLAGHSLGEYTALTCAKSLAFEDAVSLVQARGRFMQAAVPEGAGAMAAIVGLENEKVTAVCQSVGSTDDIAPANYNSIGQVVIAGKRAQVEAAIVAAKAAGAKIAMLLPVSVPSHCALMLPAAEKLKIALEKIKINSPEIPVMNNVDVSIETDPDKIKIALIKQLYSPVRFVEIIQKIKQDGIMNIIECGPGKVLSGLIKRIDKEIKTSIE